MDSSDLDLLRRYARDGSQPAFAELVRRHLDLVYSAARRQVRSSTLAEEVAQSVFLDLSREAARFNPRTPLVAWLHLVTRRTAIDVIRKESRRQHRERSTAEITRSEQTESAAMKPTPSVWTQLEPLLDEALESLNEIDRSTILLRYFENKSLREVGESLGTSEDTAQKRVTRALDRLRAFFGRRGVAIGAATLATDLSMHAVEIAPAGFASVVTANLAAPIAADSVPLTFKLMQFMTAKPILTVVTFTLLSLIGVGWTWHIDHRSQPLNRAVPNTDVEKANLPSATLTANPQTPGANLAATMPSPRASTASPDPTPTNPLDDPAYRRAVAEKSKLRLGMFYGPLFTHLNLPAAQLNRFKDLLVEKQLARADANREARADGITRSDDDERYYAAIGLGQRDVDDQLKTLLGDTGYEDYAGYERSLAKRITVERFKEALSDTEPLSADQINQLVDVLVATKKSPNLRDTVGLGIESGIGAIEPPIGMINMETVRASKKFLTPTQWQALKDFRAQIQLGKADRAVGNKSAPNSSPAQ